MEIKESWKQWGIRAGIISSILIIIIGIVWQPADNLEENSEMVSTAVPETTTDSSNSDQKGSSPAPTVLTDIQVDVSGAVANPGVYTLKIQARLADALAAAGGLNKYADTGWIARNINLATRLSDGDKIYFPKKTETQQTIIQPPAILQPGVTTTPQSAGLTTGSIGFNQYQTVAPSVTQENKDNRISLNTASKLELDSLPGVGEVTAQKIIDNRPYTKLEEVKEKKAVNKSTYEKIKDKIKL